MQAHINYDLTPRFVHWCVSSSSRYTGKERDAESGLNYFGARYYGSSMGRFMSPDPLGGQLSNPQSLNKYSYVLNNPLTNADPTGLHTCQDSTKCKSENDENFAKSLASAQTAANNLKDQYGAKSSEYTNAQRAIDAYGAQGVNNGVQVGFSSNLATGTGSTAVSGIANGDKSADNPTGQNIQVTFNPNAVGGALDGGLVAHEGAHVADGSAWVASGFSSGMDPTRYQTEINAYHVEFNVIQATPGFGTPGMNFMGNIGGAPPIPGESFKDFMPGIQNILQTNPSYGFTYKNTTPAFVKGSVVPQ